jgi:glycosyltransferase involved in cell wall biosynthesis
VKVLILHQFYNTPQSGGPLRSYYLAKALVEKGITPIVLTTHNYAETVQTSTEGIEVHYLPITYNNQFGFFKRIYSFLKFVLHTVNYAGRFKEAQVCYAISTPLTTGLAALWIKFRYKIPFHFEVGDLWPEAPIQLDIIKNSLLKFILYALEKRIYQHALSVVALSPSIQEAIHKKIPTKQIHVIPNMGDTEFYKPESKNPELEKKYTVENKFVISYIGTLGVANGLGALIDYARVCLKNNLPIQFIICGEGAERERLQKLVHQLNLSNVSMLDFKNRDGVREVMNITDAMLVCFRNLPVLETGSPNKFFDGLAAGKLLILNFKGWLKDEVEKNSCGVFVEPHDPENFINTITPIIANRDLLTEYQNNARKLAERKYSRKVLSEEFKKIFVDSVPRPPS